MPYLMRCDGRPRNLTVLGQGVDGSMLVIVSKGDDCVCKVVDRSTIARHLLSDTKEDPFSRAPLDIEDVIPHDALRQKIEQWKVDNRHKRVEQE